MVRIGLDWSKLLWSEFWIICVGIIYQTLSFNFVLHFELLIVTFTYFHWKILALAGIWTRDLPVTKPICFQLSYPGLVTLFFYFLYFLFFLLVSHLRLSQRVDDPVEGWHEPLSHKCNNFNKIPFNILSIYKHKEWFHIVWTPGNCLVLHREEGI